MFMINAISLRGKINVLKWKVNICIVEKMRGPDYSRPRFNSVSSIFQLNVQL